MSVCVVSSVHQGILQSADQETRTFSKLQPMNSAFPHLAFTLWHRHFQAASFLSWEHKSQKSLYSFPFMFACFYSLLFLSPLIPFGLTVQESVISPPQTHKTNPCYNDCVICFSFVIVGLFLSKPATNKHRKWEREEKRKATSFFLYSSVYVPIKSHN